MQETHEEKEFEWVSRFVNGVCQPEFRTQHITREREEKKEKVKKKKERIEGVYVPYGVIPTPKPW